MSEKTGYSLQDQQSSNSVLAIPIKKRHLAWTHSVSPPSGAVSCMSEGSKPSAEKPLLSETDPTIAKKAKKHSLEADVDMKAAASGYHRESVGKGGLNLVSELDKGACKVEEPTIDNRSIFPQESPSVVLASAHLSAGERNSEGKNIANSSKPTWHRVSTVTGSLVTSGSFGHPQAEYGVTPTSVVLSGLPGDGQHTDGVSVKLEKVDSCSHDLASEGQYSQLNKQSGFETKTKPSHQNRLNWDLNTTMETWEGSLGELVMNHGDTKGFELLDNHHIGQEAGSLASAQMEANGTDLTVGKSSFIEIDHNRNLSYLSMSTSEHSSFQAGLELQLRPPCKSNACLNLGVSSPLGELNPIAEMSQLSLSLSGNLDLSACCSGKAKPFDERSQNTSKQVNLRSTKVVDCRPVKLELCDRNIHEEAPTPNSACSSNMKSAASCNTNITSMSTVKPEPCEEPSQHFMKPGQLLHGESDKHNFIPSSTSLPSAMDLFSDHVKIGLVSRVTTSADITPSVTAGLEGMPMNMPSQSLAPDCVTLRIRNGANESCNDDGVSAEASHNLLESLSAQGEEANAASEAFRLPAATSSLPVEPINYDIKGSIATANLCTVIGTPASNDDMLLFAEKDEEKINSRQFDSNSNHGRNEIDEQKFVPGEILGELPGYNEHKSHNPGDVDCIKEPAIKGGERDDFEDGEVRDPILHEDEAGGCVLHGEGSSEKRGENQVHGSTDRIDVTLKMPMDEGVTQRKMEIPEESKNGDGSLCIDERDSCTSTADNQQAVLAVGQPSVSSSKKKLIKTAQKRTVDHSVNDKSCGTKSTSCRDAPSTVDKGTGDKKSGNLESSKGPDVMPDKNLPKKDVPLKVNLGKQEIGRDKHSRIIKLSSPTDKPSYGRVNSNNNKSPLVQSEKDKMTDKSIMRSKPYSRETRDGFSKDRVQKFGSDRNQDQSFGKRGSDPMRVKPRDNTHPDALHCIKNPEPEHVFERLKKSTSFRYPRHSNSTEVGYVTSDCSIPSGGRVLRQPSDDETPNLSRLPSRRRSPGPVDREGHPGIGVQVSGRSFISPGRCIGRDISDLLPFNSDEKQMRNMPDGMLDLPLRTQQRLQFEREENAFIRRERRSLSPAHRGIPSLRLRHEYLKSASRARGCSPQQWSPSRRSPNIFDGHPELAHCRSPPIITHDRMRSPRQRPFYREDVMVRRPGSPQQFITRMPEDVRELHLRRNDLMRSGRVGERNMTRFDMIDPRDAAEEEYFEHLRYNELCELADERVDSRRICDERRGFVRPIRQRFSAGEDEGLHSHVEDGPPRPFRVRSDAMEAYPDRGGSRDFNGHMRNRVGNVHDRLRGLEEREQYHGRQGWPEADFADARLKRRRL
ncbi:hypothetical protein J5N97_014876 [Dioscorea zingiberensis]|uniref:Uncharacterized protein n=1 Tax=Dioscorea zingiberensis TaxID=325984 RepID=A0A9D5CUS0_9LILI|nr:hypothetical protein J5N97_014876 [Dioscorea zingiberensis]